MKRLWIFPIIFITAWLLYPVLSFADYVIHLKSGRQFVTERYWEEGEEIKFHFKRGVLGVPKGAVVSIEEVADETPKKEETPPEPAVPEDKEDSKKTEKGVKPPEKEEVKEASKKTEEEVKKPEKEEVKKKEEAKKKEKKPEDAKPIHEYWEKKKALKLKLDDALKRLHEARGNKDAAGKKEARKDMRKLGKEIYQLTDEVKKMNNGKLPDYWWKD